MNLLTRSKAILFRGFTLKLFKGFNVVPSRKACVPTHRGQLLPFTINNLWDNPGSSRNVKRLGRGLGNGKGKTAGKGYKGQRARAGGGVSPRFEGGQAAFHRRMPKFGCPRRNRERPLPVNLSKIVEMVRKGRIDNSKVITIKDLYEANLFKRTTFGVKVLTRGLEKLDLALNLEVTDASSRAIELIKSAGGSVVCVYRTKLKLREHLKPERFPLKLREPMPPSRIVKRYEKIKERGAEVKYQEPLWVKGTKEKEEAEKPKIEEKLEKKIRKRKPEIYRTINLKLN